jgi:hypothetical protein
MIRRPLLPCLPILLAGALLGACASPVPSASGTTSPTLADLSSASSSLRPGPMSPTAAVATGTASGWTRAAGIEQPPGFMNGTTDASGQPWTRGCAPCHPAIDTLMTDVVDGPAGLVAVGWILQEFRGATWASADGSAWSFTGGFPPETFLSAVAADTTRYVAVGRNGERAIVWSSSDGRTWRQTTSTAAFAESPIRLTSVVAWHDGFVAGGFRGGDFFSANAAFWVSPDGVAWRPAPDGAAFHDARVAAIAVGGPGLVAVGEAGPADHPGPAVVWTSSDGISWDRVPDGPTFRDARMRSVANVPGIGLVAVGEDLAGSVGIAWSSPDGRTWERIPSNPLFGRTGIQVRMYDVAAGPHGVVIVGTVTEGTQYGETAVWTSPDGRRWARSPSSPELLDTEMNAVTRWGRRMVAVGDRGAPDAYQATAWVGSEAVGQ